MSNDKEQLSVESIRELLGKVAPGRWVTGGCSGRMITVEGGYCGDGFLADVDTETNAEFIAQSKSIVEFLLKENDTLKAKVEELENRLSVCRKSDDLIIKLERKVADLETFKVSEKKLSDAYLRIRTLVNSFDTPFAPTPEQIYELTENKIKDLQDKLYEAQIRYQAASNLLLNSYFQHGCQRLNETEKTMEEEIEKEFQRLKG